MERTFQRRGGRLGAGLNHDSVADPGFIQISAPGHQASFLDANLVLCRFRLRFFEVEKLGAYKGWRETPVAPDGSWFVDFSEWGGDIREVIVGVYTYICHRGLIYCVIVDQTLIEEANAIALRRGSYYAYDGQGALIIVSPGKERVIYLYQ